MITRRYSDLTQTSTAIFSDCEKYRYSLLRVWDPSKPKICFLMLNPSTADERVNDPTIERCQRRAINMGFGGLYVVNLFPLRSTDPEGLFTDDRFGDLIATNFYILEAVWDSDLVICAWGSHKSVKSRVGDVVHLLQDSKMSHKLRCLGVNQDGSPKHPLYVAYQQPVRVWPQEGKVAA